MPLSFELNWLPDAISIIIPYSLYSSEGKILLDKNHVKYEPLIKPDSRKNDSLQIDFPNMIEKEKAIVILSALK